LIRISSLRVTRETRKNSENNQVVVSAQVDGLEKMPSRLWFKFPERFREIYSRSFDPFLVAIIFPAMRTGQDIVIHGHVSPMLLRNLEEFQSAWSLWDKQRYRRIDISPEGEETNQIAPGSNQAIAAFTGGVDSFFTALRHLNSIELQYPYDIQAGLMISGLDIHPARINEFHRKSQIIGTTLNNLGVVFIPVESNIYHFRVNWIERVNSYTNSIAAGMMLFKQAFPYGLVASTYPYTDLKIPHSSNPVVDHLLSSDSFKLIHDGASYDRIEKTRIIAPWGAVQKGLRVCWEGDDLSENCCECEKCIRTILGYKSIGFEVPTSFPHRISNWQILGLKFYSFGIHHQYKVILEYAWKNRRWEPWVGTLYIALLKNLMILFIKDLAVTKRTRQLLAKV
jgi:hypothetical protein